MNINKARKPLGCLLMIAMGVALLWPSFDVSKPIALVLFFLLVWCVTGPDP